jgi:hypothetical protein
VLICVHQVLALLNQAGDVTALQGVLLVGAVVRMCALFVGSDRLSPNAAAAKYAHLVVLDTSAPLEGHTISAKLLQLVRTKIRRIVCVASQGCGGRQTLRLLVSTAAAAGCTSCM